MASAHAPSQHIPTCFSVRLQGFVLLLGACILWMCDVVLGVATSHVSVSVYLPVVCAHMHHVCVLQVWLWQTL